MHLTWKSSPHCEDGIASGRGCGKRMTKGRGSDGAGGPERSEGGWEGGGRSGQRRTVDEEGNKKPRTQEGLKQWKGSNRKRKVKRSGGRNLTRKGRARNVPTGSQGGRQQKEAARQQPTEGERQQAEGGRQTTAGGGRQAAADT
mmetsp:Transcript_13360/g.36937  ORF Transcript_13360/g.36937 Transcript_13360/m.36937 type:complete len:144 (+) Transcript_13360:2190-2621(+)